MARRSEPHGDASRPGDTRRRFLGVSPPGTGAPVGSTRAIGSGGSGGGSGGHHVGSEGREGVGGNGAAPRGHHRRDHSAAAALGIEGDQAWSAGGSEGKSKDLSLPIRCFLRLCSLGHRLSPDGDDETTGVILLVWLLHSCSHVLLFRY